MPSTDTRNGPRHDLHELPQFELDYLVDNVDAPTEVMVVPKEGHDRDKTRWITMDLGSAVPLDDVR